MFTTIKTNELENVTGGGGSSGIKIPLSQKPVITGTATPALVKKLEQINRPGFDFAIAK
jgi:bacteriocin-like protein